MIKAIPMEDWLRGCVYHDGRHGEVTLPTNEVLKIANYIQRTRQSTTDGLIDLEVVEVEHKTEPLKTTDYCVICKQDMCRDWIADATNPYCVPSHYEIKQTNNTGHKTEPQSEKEQTMRLIDADALIEVQIYDEEHEEWSVETMTVEECLARFADVPTIIETDRPQGEWIEIDDVSISCRCSVCGWEAHLYEDDVYGMPYCPNCGARMKGADDGEEGDY